MNARLLFLAIPVVSLSMLGQGLPPAADSACGPAGVKFKVKTSDANPTALPAADPTRATIVFVEDQLQERPGHAPCLNAPRKCRLPWTATGSRRRKAFRTRRLPFSQAITTFAPREATSSLSIVHCPRSCRFMWKPGRPTTCGRGCHSSTGTTYRFSTCLKSTRMRASTWSPCQRQRQSCHEDNLSCATGAQLSPWVC